MTPDSNWLAALPKQRLLAEFSLWSADLARLADDMARVSPEEVIDYNNKTDLSHDTISNHIAALRYAFRLCQAQSENPL